MTAAAIEVEKVGKKYRIGTRERYHTLRDKLTRAFRSPFRREREKLDDEVWAIRDLSLKIGAGETVGIIGRNGAGKSTLLKLLARITTPTEGEINILGRIGTLLEVGTGFHPELSGRENLFLNGAILGMRRDEINKNFDEIVAFAEIEKFIDTPVKRYSSGMYMRLAFAVAAHLQPEILIVDEVLAVGDVQFQEKCLGKMKAVASEGRTILFVSHNMAAIAQLCSRAVLLERGRLKADGPVANVIEQYWLGAGLGVANSTVAPEQHAYGRNLLQLLEVRLLNSVGETFSVHWKDRIEIELVFNVHEQIGRAVVGLALFAPTGSVILDTHSTDNRTAAFELNRGMCKVRLTLENPLRSGRYNIAVGAESALGKGQLFYVGDAARLTVLETSASGEVCPHHLHGLVNAPATWEPPEYVEQNQDLQVAQKAE